MEMYGCVRLVINLFSYCFIILLSCLIFFLTPLGAAIVVLLDESH